VFAINAIMANFSLTASSRPVEKEHIWKKPAPGTYKLNTDASYHVDGSGSVGMVLRNDHGEALGGFACPINSLLSPATAEAMVIAKGLEFLEQIGVSNVTIESDSLELIQACNSETEIWSPYSVVLADCFMRALSFSSISFDHCPREVNQVAHHLAKYSYKSNSVIRWDGDPPILLSLL
jgi:ribonuclease HI